LALVLQREVDVSKRGLRVVHPHQSWRWGFKG
jgi:hypothetical protein